MTELSDDRLYKRFKEAQKQQTPTSSFDRDIKIEGHDLQYLRIMVHYKYKVTIHIPLNVYQINNLNILSPSIKATSPITLFEYQATSHFSLFQF